MNSRRFAAVATCLVAVTACGRFHLAESSPTPLSTPSSAASPTAAPTVTFRPTDVDVVDASVGWILTFSGCPQPEDQCQFAVARTDDGGTSWSRPVAVGPTFLNTDGDGPRRVHFLNRLDGFVYGHAAAFVTHDGGRTWNDAGIPRDEVIVLTGRGTIAWALTRDCAKGVVCPYTVRRSTDGGRTWTPHLLPDSVFSPSDAIPFGVEGVLVSTATDMAATSDGGATWRLIKSPCIGNQTFRSFVSTPDGQEIWQLCTGLLNGLPSDRALFVSEDGGASWSARSSSSAGTLPATGPELSLVATRRGTAFVTSGLDPISETHDSGASWAPILAPLVDYYPKGFGFEYLRFDAAGDAWALDFEERLWASHDDGETWSKLPVTA